MATLIPGSLNPEAAISLEAEWQRIRTMDLDVTGNRDYALLWVLVHAFGTVEHYQNNVEFHAQVTRAAQMVEALWR